MEYEIECGKCRRRYRISAAEGQTVRSSCPYCGQTMLVNLPKTIPEKGGKPSGGTNWLLKGLAIILVGLVLGVAGWYVWQGREQQRRAEEAEYRAARAARQDSLARLQAKLQQEARETQRQVAEQQAVIEFLVGYYRNCFFGDESPDSYERHLSEKCYKKLHNTVDMYSEKGSQIAWYQLGPAFETQDDLDRDIEELAKNFDISHGHDKWYKVRFSARGITEYREIEAFPYRDRIIINDFR